MRTSNLALLILLATASALLAAPHPPASLTENIESEREQDLVEHVVVACISREDLRGALVHWLKLNDPHGAAHAQNEYAQRTVCDMVPRDTLTEGRVVSIIELRQEIDQKQVSTFVHVLECAHRETNQVWYILQYA